jgi:predicted transcriptional regulator
MRTTTIRLEDALKARVLAAAERAGTTAHAFMLDAIAHTVEQHEVDRAFDALADQRWTQAQSSGKTVAWDQAKVFLTARAQGAPVRKPVARKLGAKAK